MNIFNISRILKYLYWAGLGIMVISIPIFNVGMSIGAIWLISLSLVYFIVSSFFDLNIKSELNNPFTNPLFLVPLAFYLMHFAGMFCTEDLAYGWRDLKIKSPLVVLPFALTYLPKIKPKTLEYLLWLFVSAVMFSVITSLMVYWNIVDIAFQNVRDITVRFITRISHIRLSLSIDFALIILFYLSQKSIKKLVLSVLFALPLLYFLWIVQSITGIVILLILIGFTLLRFIYKSANLKTRIISGVLLLGIIVFTFSYINNTYRNYYKVSDSFENLIEKSVLGNPYHHNPSNKAIENHHYLWLNIAQQEVKEAWNTRSELEASGLDHKGQELYMTMLRYMTSLGLTKDAAGISQLTNMDIQSIEQGIANATWKDMSPLEKRAEAIIFELDNYSRGGNPSGNSVTQRLEFWKAGWIVFKKSPVFGCGTGDINVEMSTAYAEMGTLLDKEHQLRCHNQYLSLAATFGIFGIVFFVLLLVIPMFQRKVRSNYLHLVFLIISVLSFVTEETLETQAGISFFAFFYVFLVLVDNTKSSNSSEEIFK